MKYYKLNIFNECALVKEKILELEKEREEMQKAGNVLKKVEILKEISILILKNFGKESDEFIKTLIP